MMIQPIVSSPITDNMTPVKFVSRSDGARISNPISVPPTRGSMVRFEITASASTTRVGTRHTIPVSAMSRLHRSVLRVVHRHDVPGCRRTVPGG